MIERLSEPWPWYVAGPLIGLMTPLLLLLGGRQFGISANLRHLCAAALPKKPAFFQYDWWKAGAWNLTFALGIVLGGWIASAWLGGGGEVILAPETISALADLGMARPNGLVPEELFSLGNLTTLPSLIMLMGGGFLVGFGARYAGGCTSGHAISGLASRQLPSLIAVLGFFAGGLLATHFLLPWVLR